MNIEKSDNTKVKTPLIHPIGENKEKLKDLQYKEDQLWDGDKVNKYQNLQNFYNNNFFGYGVFGKQTNLNPRTQQQEIQSNFDYSKGNAKNFGEQLVTGLLAEGAITAAKYATTPIEIGSGAEAVVTSTPISTKVTKITSIPRSEMHMRNSIPGALKSQYAGTKNGLTMYTQPKVKILSEAQLAKASEAIEKLMSSKGWRKVTHPNLDGLGFTNGRYVVSDLGQGNVGKDLLGRVKLVDFALETVPEFRLAMQKFGGKIRESKLK